MKKQEIAKQMARQTGDSPAEAADRLDGVLRHILSSLRRGKETPLPGLGKFMPGRDGRVAFRREGGRRRG